MGFAKRLIFAAAELAGELASMTMGLGFATFFDPQSQGRSAAISSLLTLLTLLTLLVYLALPLDRMFAEGFGMIRQLTAALPKT